MCCIKKKRRVRYKKRHSAGVAIEYGWFVDYGLDVIETNETIVSYTVAIIENERNGIELVNVNDVEFVP